MTDVKLHIVAVNENTIELNFPNGMDCFEHHGMGYFLKDWEDGEVTATQDAKDIMLKHGKKMDLGGIELWEDKILGFMQAVIDKEGISVNNTIPEWLKDLPVVQ